MGTARGTEDIFDMWEAHTTHCSQCRGALQKLTFVKGSALSLAAASLIAVPSGAERAVCVFGLLAAAAAIDAVSTMFYRYEYSHADEYGPLDWYLDAIGKRG